ncbi:MAG TPA: NUDIX hydrolase [Fimbriimonadaceae bacterium]|nr:NUDIX hydrolase [Fimbriimonadaceae bacterium]
MRKFPSGKYGRQTLTFYPAPFRSPLRAFAGLVFPWRNDMVLCCDILGRGWCVPSGRVEPDEESIEAVRREAVEEAGAILDQLQYIGAYQIVERAETRWADVYTAGVLDLVDIQLPEESRGRRFFTLDELPGTYHIWNELTEQVFRHAHDVFSRLKNF